MFCDLFRGRGSVLDGSPLGGGVYIGGLLGGGVLRGSARLGGAGGGGAPGGPLQVLAIILAVGDAQALLDQGSAFLRVNCSFYFWSRARRGRARRGRCATFTSGPKMNPAQTLLEQGSAFPDGTKAIMERSPAFPLGSSSLSFWSKIRRGPFWSKAER